MQVGRRDPLSEDHHLLGRHLRTARERSGATTREVAHYSSGHISNVENGHATPSRELVEYYITAYGCERGRALRLFEKVRNWATRRRRHGHNNAEPTIPRPATLTVDSPIDSIRDCYRIIESESHYRLDDRGVIRELTIVRSITALYPGVHLVAARFWYPTDPRPGRQSVQAGLGCSVAQLRTTPVGWLVAILRLPQDLTPTDHQPHSLAVTIRNNSDVRAQPVVYHHHRLPFPVSRYAMRVQFDSSAQPGRVWRFRDTDSSVGTFEPDNQQALGPTESGFYFSDFLDVESEERVGMGWEW